MAGSNNSGKVTSLGEAMLRLYRVSSEEQFSVHFRGCQKTPSLLRGLSYV